MVLGVGTGEALNEIAVGLAEWPDFKERFARLREAVELMRELWAGERVTFEGDYYRTVDATIYDRPEAGVPIYIAAGGPQMAKYAGRVGDGFICTSGKGMDLYTDKLLPAVDEGAAAAGRAARDIDRMIEIKLSYDRDPERGAGEHPVLGAAVADARARSTGSHDPVEMAAAADAPADRAGRLALDHRHDADRGRRRGPAVRRRRASTTSSSTAPGTTRSGSSPTSASTWHRPSARFAADVPLGRRAAG